MTDAQMKLNSRRVMEYAFAYVAGDGTKHTGTCYAEEGDWSLNDKVTVWYLSGSPEIAEIQGGRLDKAGLAGVFVIIFPLAGFGMVLWFVFQRKKADHLLLSGQVAEADIISVEMTSMKVNRQPVYAITLSAPHLPAGGRQTIHRVNLPEVTLAERHAANKQPVFVLYDPQNPDRLIFPEALIDQ